MTYLLLNSLVQEVADALWPLSKVWGSGTRSLKSTSLNGVVVGR